MKVPFSRRTTWDLRPNAIAARLAGKRPRFDLTEGNPTRVGLGWDADSLRAALDVRGAERYEPEPQGLLAAREAIAAWHNARGHAPRVDSLFLTASTSDAYSWVFKLLADPGDAVLVPRPGYPLFEYLAGMEGVAVEHYAMRFDGDWWLDLDGIRTRLAATSGPRVRAVVVVNPGNPTGAFLSNDEAEALAALCGESGVAIVSDEVFADYAHDPHPVGVMVSRGFAPMRPTSPSASRRAAPIALPLLARSIDPALAKDAGSRRRESLRHLDGVLTFCLSGLSKVAALPQLKLAWLDVSGNVPEATEARQRLEVIADTWLPAATPVQLAAPAILSGALRVQARILGRVRANFAALRGALGPDSPASVLPVEGGWYAVLRVPSTRTDEEWVLHLLDVAEVLVQPGYFFDFEKPGHLVVSLLPEPALFAEAATRLAASI